MTTFHEVARRGPTWELGGGAAENTRTLSRDSAYLFNLMGENPAASALRQDVRLLGQRLYALTKSDKIMLDTCSDVAALAPEQDGQRIAIMSSAWDGSARGRHQNERRRFRGPRPESGVSIVASPSKAGDRGDRIAQKLEA